MTGSNESHPSDFQALKHKEESQSPTNVQICPVKSTSKFKSKYDQNPTLSPSTAELSGAKIEPVVKLIGRKAIIQCNLNGIAVAALLDTGAQVSIIDRNWKDKYLPSHDTRPLTELLEGDGKLEVYTVNGDAIPFEGWVAITVNLPGTEDPSLSINVPFLVSHLPLERPLLEIGRAHV